MHSSWAHSVSGAVADDVSARLRWSKIVALDVYRYKRCGLEQVGNERRLAAAWP